MDTKVPNRKQIQLVTNFFFTKYLNYLNFKTEFNQFILVRMALSVSNRNGSNGFENSGENLFPVNQVLLWKLVKSVFIDSAQPVNIVAPP